MQRPCSHSVVHLIHFPGGVLDKGRLLVTAWNVSYFVGVKGTERNTVRKTIIIELWAMCSAGLYRTTERCGGHWSADCSLSQTTGAHIAVDCPLCFSVAIN
jgi:hypothetical protein